MVQGRKLSEKQIAFSESFFVFGVGCLVKVGVIRYNKAG